MNWREVAFVAAVAVVTMALVNRVSTLKVIVNPQG